MSEKEGLLMSNNELGGLLFALLVVLFLFTFLGIESKDISDHHKMVIAKAESFEGFMSLGTIRSVDLREGGLRGKDLYVIITEDDKQHLVFQDDITSIIKYPVVGYELMVHVSTETDRIPIKCATEFKFKEVS